jgi:thiol-disulfide isomerase/thioredoxin
MIFKKMKKMIVVMALFMFRLGHAQAIVEPIQLPNVADGKIVTIAPCASCKGVVVIFTSLSCPYDQHYRDRIKSLSEKYAGQVSFFLINANPGEDEAAPKMKAAYDGWGLSVPYLSDKSQTAMTAFNAKRTPEAVLLKPNGNGLTVIYQGAIDDNPQVHNDTGINFLDDAIGALLANQSPRVTTERVIGCTIKKP